MRIWGTRRTWGHGDMGTWGHGDSGRCLARQAQGLEGSAISSSRLCTSNLPYILLVWARTVPGAMDEPLAISAFDFPSMTSTAMCSSRGFSPKRAAAFPTVFRAALSSSLAWGENPLMFHCRSKSFSRKTKAEVAARASPSTAKTMACWRSGAWASGQGQTAAGLPHEHHGRMDGQDQGAERGRRRPQPTGDAAGEDAGERQVAFVIRP